MSRSPHSHSPRSVRPEHAYHSPKRGQKSPSRISSKSSKHISHVPANVSPHNSRSSRKSSNRSRPKYSRSPPKNFHSRSGSSSPIKDSRFSKKYSDSDSPDRYSKRKKSAKSPMKQFNSKVKLSETSLFAELVKDRQMRELAMKRLTQINTKNSDENEIVEIHDDSDTEQNSSKIENLNAKAPKNDVRDDVDSCIIIDHLENSIQSSKRVGEISKVKSITDMAPKISNEKIQSPSVSKVDESIENGIEHSLESISSLTPKLTPTEDRFEINESIDLTKLPMPPVLSEDYLTSPDSEIKCTKKSIKDLPLPPGKFLKNTYSFEHVLFLIIILFFLFFNYFCSL